MKIGTDGVLLGAWVSIEATDSVLDIGTGTGLIALMIAQRTNGQCKIDAVEIDDNACQDADENFRQSPWPNSLHLNKGRIQDFGAELKYKLITANPPYFNNSLQSPDVNRAAARHTESLKFEELVASVNRLMHPDGRFGVILPPTEAKLLEQMMNETGLHTIRSWSFKSRKEKPVERRLMEFSRMSGKHETGEIILYDDQNSWSESYLKLTQDFYLRR